MLFLVRGLLPWGIIWAVNPSLGPIQALTATFSKSARYGIRGNGCAYFIGGRWNILLFILHWLFLEEKHFGLPHFEKFSLKTAFGFFASVSILLTVIVWFALKQKSHDGFWRSGWINSVFVRMDLNRMRKRKKNLKNKIFQTLARFIFGSY